MPDEFSFGGTGLRALALDLEAAAQSLAPAATVTLIAIGGRVEERAKRNALSYVGTSTTPQQMQYGGNTKQDVADSIHGHLEGANAYQIRFGEGVPLAGLWELGNRRSTRHDTHFRHPLFGDRNHWYEQPKHMFLRPAMEESSAEIQGLMEDTWDRALGPYGLMPEGAVLANVAAPGAHGAGRVPAGYPGGHGGEFMSLGG